MKSYRFISVIAALLLSLASLSAQTAFSLKGTVTDEEGIPLYGCIVYISETKGTVTDSLGHYSLSIPNDKTVEIHYECLGYEGVVLTFSPESAFPMNPDVVLKIDPTLPEYVIIMDPSPTPVRPVEPPTPPLVTSPGTNHVKATKPDSSFCGRFDGVEGGKHRRKPIAYYVLLELNSDYTCSLEKSFDLSRYMGRGEWTMLDDGVIELRFNKNSVLSDIEKALMSGGLIEGTLEIQVLSKNKLKMGDTVLKRIK